MNSATAPHPGRTFKTVCTLLRSFTAHLYVEVVNIIYTSFDIIIINLHVCVYVEV